MKITSASGARSRAASAPPGSGADRFAIPFLAGLLGLAAVQQPLDATRRGWSEVALPDVAITRSGGNPEFGVTPRFPSTSSSYGRLAGVHRAGLAPRHSGFSRARPD
jgi:hypothetical protein